MSVARGKTLASLLQRGYGVRSTPSISAFSGLHLPALTSDERSAPTPFVGDVDFGRRFLHARAGARARRQSRLPKVMSNKPTMETAKAMPLSVQEMKNEEVIILGAMGNSSACKEILRRHIMDVDKVSYETASEKFEEIAAENRKGMWLLSLPYKIGITVAVSAAACSFPLVFDLDTVSWFNENYVTADVPEPKDLETPLEVGSWSWNWMEPPLGQISFMLLCLQYTR